MKTLEFIPIILFFLVYKLPEKSINLVAPVLPEAWVVYLSDLKPFALALIVIMIATLIQFIIQYAKNRTVEKMQVVVLVILFVMGVPSLMLDNPVLFMWKPTVVNWLFAGAFLASHYIASGQPIIQRMLGSQIELPEEVWFKLSYAWVAFFINTGILNIAVAYSVSEAAWVNFKLFGLLGLTVLFVVAQGIYLTRHIKDEGQVQDTE